MKFIIPHVDLRHQGTGGAGIDDDAGKRVGEFSYSHGNRERTVLLFGKYGATFNTPEECQAFADGVAAVLTHMTSYPGK